jgi:uncharacterized SAM-binding protein YcdF (DUF218 family)
MIYLHKIIPLFFSPLILFMALIFYGAYAKKKGACYTGITLLYLLSTPIVSDEIFRFTEDYAVKKTISTIPKANAIVVLSGTISHTKSEDGLVEQWGTPNRFFGGIALIKAQKSDQLIFTKALMPWSTSKTTEGDVLKKMALSLGVPEASIHLTKEVQNTRDEAVEVKAVLNIENPEVILVTSAFHMARAKKLFEREGIRVIPYPVDFMVAIDATTPMDFLPNTHALWLTDTAVREFIGRLYYKFVSLS